jgi:non-ribosomal peptide synthetase-like protein
LVAVVPRLLNRLLEPDTEYPLFSGAYFVQGLLSAFSNSDTLNVLFGDSSYIVQYLRLVGWRLNEVDQTGANFGMDQTHDNPFLCDIGSGTMMSDDITLANMEVSATSFRLREVKIGARNYIGNSILYPAGGRTGDNVLLANKVLVPVDGPVRQNVGLLGSPSFEIPRVVARDREAAVQDAPNHRARLGRKNRYNLNTIGAYLLVNLAFMFATLLSFYVSLIYYWQYGVVALAAYSVFMLVFSIAFWVLAERTSLRFGSLRTGVVDMYDRSFLRHERHWKFCAHSLVQVFAGTPLKPFIYRLLGVKMGRMVFDDGADIFDKTLIEIGDYANLNVGADVQGHSLEEGVFKSGRVRVGKGACLSCGALVHYDVEFGDGATLGANAFLMKGERVPAGARWCGNPAQEV